MDTAEKLRLAERYGQQTETLDVAGRLALRKLEMTVGKRMSVNVNLRTQEDLSETTAKIRALPPAERAALERALDLVGEAERGNVLPAVALSSMKANE